MSLVNLTPLDFDLPAEPPDWVFFASAFGVKCFFEGTGSSSPEGIFGNLVRFAALGPATAAALYQYIPEIHFVGTGDPGLTAAEFLSLAKGQTILFPAAVNSRRSVADLLEEYCTVSHLPVYENTPLSGAPFLPEDVLVFTSPMNAQAYLSRHRPEQKQTLIAIGATTAQTFRAFGVSDFMISPEASEAALAESVLRSRT